MIYFLFRSELPYTKRKEFHADFEGEARLLQKYAEKHGGKLIGVWNVEMGPVSEFMLLWAAKDLASYEKTVQDLKDAPEGKEVRSGKFPSMFGRCERYMLSPTSYSPLQ